MKLFSANQGEIADVDSKNFSAPNQGAGKKSDGKISALNLIGKDDRHVFQDSNYPWNLNGFIEYKDGRNSSGILIGKRLVLTCYHCIDFSAPKDMYFVPAKYKNPAAGTKEEPFGRFKVKDAYWWGKDRPTTGTNEYGSMDFAVLELETESGLGYAGWRWFEDAWLNKSEWFHVGYPYNNLYGLKDLIQGRPIYQMSIQATDIKEYDYKDSAGDTWKGKKLFTDADIEGGQSGGALFQTIDDFVMVSSPLGSQGSKDTGGAACANLMGKLITWCRENLDK